MSKELSQEKIPIWYWLLTLLAILPLFLVPMYISDIEASEYEVKKLFLWFYVPYVIVASSLSLFCYKYDRKIMSWILYVLMILTHISIYMLIYCDL